MDLRLPRVIAALILGSTLALSGLVFQTILGNPLVEPGFLGVSQGAAFGAALVIILNISFPLALPLSAGLFALIALALAWSLAKAIRFGGWIIRLILAGIIISALFASGLGVLKYLADPRSQLQEITFWMMGGLTGIGWEELGYLLPLTLPALILICALRWRLNLLSMGDRTAHSLGISPLLEKEPLPAACRHSDGKRCGLLRCHRVDRTDNPPYCPPAFGKRHGKIGSHRPAHGGNFRPDL